MLTKKRFSSARGVTLWVTVLPGTCHCTNQLPDSTYLEVVELAIHLDYRDLVVIVRVWAVRELDAREGAGQLAAARDPRNGGALVEEVGRVEEVDTLLLDHARSEDLALIVVGDELGRQHLDHDV